MEQGLFNDFLKRLSVGSRFWRNGKDEYTIEQYCAILKVSPSAFEDFPNDIQRNEVVIKEAVSRASRNLRYIKRDYITLEICRIALKNGFRGSINYVPGKFITEQLLKEFFRADEYVSKEALIKFILRTTQPKHMLYMFKLAGFTVEEMLTSESKGARLWGRSAIRSQKTF